MYTSTLFSAFIASALAIPQFNPRQNYQQQQPYCADGGQLHCCQATFNGGMSPVKELSNLGCYDLTPATVNCIIADDTNGQQCSGTYSCCQVNDLVPLLGLFCSAPPGGCVGPEEGNGQCTNIFANGNGGRFGQCSPNDVSDMRQSAGLEPLGQILKSVF